MSLCIPPTGVKSTGPVLSPSRHQCVPPGFIYCSTHLCLAVPGHKDSVGVSQGEWPINRLHSLSSPTPNIYILLVLSPSPACLPPSSFQIWTLCRKSSSRYTFYLILNVERDYQCFPYWKWRNRFILLISNPDLYIRHLNMIHLELS